MLNGLLDGLEIFNGQVIQAYFLQALTWSLGAALLEDARVKFDAFIKFIATMVLIEPSVAPAGLGSYNFKLLLYRPKPIHCNYQLAHYSGFC